MDKTTVQSYCRRYFDAVGATVQREESFFLQVELPRDVDKELTDRPFYWMYIDATGQDVPNTVLNLSFDANVEIDDVEKMELVALGSFRLNRIFDSVHKRGRLCRAYEAGNSRLPLTPYLITTFKVSFIADRCRDEILSYGVNMVTGDVILELYDELEDKQISDLTSDVIEGPNRPLLHQTMLSLEEGWNLLQDAVKTDIYDSDHSWAQDAQAHLREEIEQLQTYYQSLAIGDQDQMAVHAAERELRIAEVTWRCKPRVEVIPFHIGVVYLHSSAIKVI